MSIYRARLNLDDSRRRPPSLLIGFLSSHRPVVCVSSSSTVHSIFSILTAISRRANEEVFNRGNLNVADELFAPNFVHHDPTSGEDWHGSESVKRYAAMLRAAFPDLHQTIEEQIAEGDKVAYRWTASGTHQGELMGIAPTGNRVMFTGISIARLADGKIEEIWENYDALGMMQQLGVIPSIA